VHFFSVPYQHKRGQLFDDPLAYGGDSPHSVNG
jgi:hypothetical protein